MYTQATVFRGVFQARDDTKLFKVTFLVRLIAAPAYISFMFQRPVQLGELLRSGKSNGRRVFRGSTCKAYVARSCNAIHLDTNY